MYIYEKIGACIYVYMHIEMCVCVCVYVCVHICTPGSLNPQRFNKPWRVWQLQTCLKPKP